MDREAARELANHLARDERLLWSGRPDRMGYMRTGLRRELASTLPLSLAALVALGLIAFGFGEWTSATGMRVGVVLLALAVVAMAAARLMPAVKRHFEAPRIAYGLTERRAIFLVSGDGSRIEEIPANAFAEIETVAGKDGLQAVLFADAAGRGGFPSVASGAGARRGFVAIRDAAAVAPLLKEVAGRSPRPDRAPPR